MDILLPVALAIFSGCHKAKLPSASPPSPASVGGQSLVPSPLAPMPNAKAALELALAAWPKRDERPALEQAIGAFERAFLMSPTDANIAARLAHGYFLLGHVFLREAHDHAGMQKAFGRGVVVAEMGLRLASAPLAARLARGEAVEDAIDALEAPAMASLVAYTENIGALSALRGRTSGLFFAERLRACIERMLVLDEGFAKALPHQFMALWFEHVPSFAGGSHKQAQLHFDAALRLSNDALENLIVAVEQSPKTPAYAHKLRAWANAPLQAPAPTSGDELVSGDAEYRLAERAALRWLESGPSP